MSTLAKTSDYYPPEDVSEYQSPSVLKSSRRLEPLDLNTIRDLKTLAYDDSSQIKIKQPHLIKRKLFTFQRTFKLLQEWEGKVEKVGDETFLAIIKDKTRVDNPDEDVEIFMSEISPEDRSFVRPGALFYWSVGYEEGQGVPRQRVSRIRFRRVPGITTRDIARANKNAKILDNLFA